MGSGVVKIPPAGMRIGEKALRDRRAASGGPLKGGSTLEFKLSLA